MGNERTIRAWKDPDFRDSLDPNEDANVPASPVGTVDLDDIDLGAAPGGSMPISQTSICQTSLPCAASIAIGISNQLSCGTCQESMWHGTCGFSSVGCC